MVLLYVLVHVTCVSARVSTGSMTAQLALKLGTLLLQLELRLIGLLLQLPQLVSPWERWGIRTSFSLCRCLPPSLLKDTLSSRVCR